MQSAPDSTSRFLILATFVLGVISFGVVLLFHNIADGDLWAKLALGAAVWKDGQLPMHDVFAFTPVLPVYVDHEWGSGLAFFTFLKLFGPGSLLLLKILLAFITLGAALLLARRFEPDWPALLALAVPCALCVLPGFVPVIRSHAFTYACFSTTLLLLELMRAGKRWPAVVLVLLMILWVNLHGGFVAGLGTIGIYTLFSLIERKTPKVFMPAFLACAAATMINPYGPKYWTYVLPALLHKRLDIVEWQPMPLWGNDAFIGFRLLMVLTICFLIFGRRAENKSLPGLCMLFITAVLALRSRRHAPFFGVAVLAFAGPFVGAAIRAIAARASAKSLAKTGFGRIVFAGFITLAFVVSMRFLPGAAFQVLAPVSQFPVREADILARAGLSGNAAVPFEWGSYASWRLYPNIKVSMDGRYEAAYPESTYEMNRDFFTKRGPDWDRLLKRHTVDFVMLDLQLSKLKPEDLSPKGYVTVWKQEGVSALVVLNKHAELLQKIVADLPPFTIEALDASIPYKWPRF
jgi:hypothetical protein